MADDAAYVKFAIDDRTPYAVAQAVVTTITRLSNTLTTDDAVIAALIEAQGPQTAKYIRTIRRAQHSVFYHHLQFLYEFGRTQVRPEARSDFCVACGRTFLEAAFVEQIYFILQMAMAQPGDFQETVARNLQAQIYQYAGEKYLFDYKIQPDAIQIDFRYRKPGAFARYLASFDLDPGACFRNSFDLMAGAIESLVRQIVAGYDAPRFEQTCDGEVGIMRLPIGKDDRFDYEKLIPLLVGYIHSLRERQEKDRADELLESGLIIDSPLMREKWSKIRRASRSEETVLLRGESGTGKSFIARKIHNLSPRCEKPFVEVSLVADIGSDNMIQSDLFGHERGAFTGATDHKKGLFSLADGGTIFLDEIGDASPELQGKLLRVLEDKTFKRLGGMKDISVDVRIIAATNCNLEQMVREGKFRDDLYYRVNVIPLRLPPLRERREEIPALAEFLLARAQAGHRLANGLAEQLAGFDWPGNIRQLDHALRNAAAMAESDQITARDLPEEVRARLGAMRHDDHAPPPRPGSGPLIDVESLRHYIRSTPPLQAAGSPQDCPAHIEYAKHTWLKTLIDECGGDLALIARYWDRSSEKTLRNLIRHYGLAEHLAAARSRAHRQ